jgi:methylaspartate mutase epsilon subunit
MREPRRHSILLGGVGGDSHVIGLTILHQALSASGYDVTFLGAQNRLSEIFRLSHVFDVVMISSMDGHVRQYVREFPALVRTPQVNRPLWYLGGNLTIGDALGHERDFHEMGFDRVFVKFTDLRHVLEILAADLSRRKSVGHMGLLAAPSEKMIPHGHTGLSDDRLEPDAFHSARREVLEQWRTGAAARDLDRNARFLAQQPTFAHAQQRVNEGSAPILIQPRAGVPLATEQVRLFRAFQSAGVSVLSYQVDSLTRNNNYAGAEEGLRESRKSRRATLNGFPVINHGPATLRRIARDIGAPMQIRHGTHDPRLLAEISYAGGVSSFEGGPISYNLPYFKAYPVDEAIRHWQYVDRLTGLYHDEYGIVLDREFFGPLTGTLVPPCVAIAVGILEAVLAVQQGVRCVSVGYGEGGHRVQDIAAVRLLRSLTHEILRNMGYAHVQVNTVFHQYMAAFPNDHRRAAELIFHSAVTAKLANVTRIINKTAVEALRIPSLEDNLGGIDLVRRGIAAADGEYVDETAIAVETDLMRREVMALLERVIHCGGRSIADGIVAAFRDGYLDIPFAPSVFNRGEAITARDAAGAIRFLSVGRLPFDRDVREFHRERTAVRTRSGGGSGGVQPFLVVEHDVLQVPRGEYTQWPLDGRRTNRAAEPWLDVVSAAAPGPSAAPA